LIVGVVFGLATVAGAQPPSADWRTIETSHFRVHYTTPAEAWSLRAAARLDAIRERLVDEIGHEPAGRTDVIVTDPIAAPNGFALPFLAGPRIVLYTTAPAADSEIGNYLDWGELLTIHEDAHVVHLTRPSRNPVPRLFERFWLPVGPIVRGAPRWAVEGYATLLEGELTGAGRPAGHLRAAILRRWAQRGRLPTYSQLASDPTTWRGMSMAYLGGSAFLEWLRDRSHDEAFRHLWRRLSAREPRGFDQAFAGVFGAPPDELYGRFTAELTASAMSIERSLAPSRRDGELWQHLTWTTGAPAVSPDGTQMAVVLRDRRQPSRMVVWSTGPPDEEERRFDERLARTLARDPADVAPVRGVPLPRLPRYEMRTVNGAEPMWPRWMPDGRSLLFVRAEPDGAGVLHPDLFRWHLESGRIERLTRQARVWRPDPSPDGTWAVAVRQQHGLSELVRVRLADGAIESLTPASVDTAYDHPRISPDGRRLAYLRLDAGAWRLVVRDLEHGRDTVVETPAGAFVAHPAWSRDGRTLYLSVGQGGFIDVHAARADGTGPALPLTRVDGAALSPEPAGDGRLFFLALEPHGYDLRVLTDDEAATPLSPLVIDATLVPAVPPAAAARTEWRSFDPVPGRKYGAGRQEPMVIAGGTFAPSAQAWELGARGGDVVGRLDYLAVASLARDGRGPRGVAAAGAWRGWPVALGVHTYVVDEEPSRQPVEAPGIGAALDARMRGVEARADWTRRLGGAARVDAESGVRLGSIEPVGGISVSARALWTRAGYAARPSRGPWHWRHGASLIVERGRTGDDDWWRAGTQLDTGAGHLNRSLRVTWRRTTTGGAPGPFDLVRLGGLQNSLLPRSLFNGRVLTPALPAGIGLGTDHEMQRVTLSHGDPGVSAFYERHRLWTDPGAPGGWLALAGAEVAVALPPLPVARLPALSLTTGVARIFDEPDAGRTRIWFGLAWRP
jgi:hypothetical protein